MKLETIWGDRKTATDMAARTALVFGGSNMTEGTGRWYDEDGELWLEPSYTVTVYTRNVHARREHSVMAASVLDSSSEISALVVVNDDAEFLLNSRPELAQEILNEGTEK